MKSRHQFILFFSKNDKVFLHCNLSSYKIDKFGFTCCSYLPSPWFEGIKTRNFCKFFFLQKVYPNPKNYSN